MEIIVNGTNEFAAHNELDIGQLGYRAGDLMMPGTERIGIVDKFSRLLNESSYSLGLVDG